MKFFDMESIMLKDKCLIILYKSIDVGPISCLAFNSEVMRLSFLSNLDQLIISPVPHRNMIRLMGST